MKKYHKVGGKKGKPAYRTPSSFIYRKSVKVIKRKMNNQYRKLRSL